MSSQLASQVGIPVRSLTGAFEHLSVYSENVHYISVGQRPSYWKVGTLERDTKIPPPDDGHPGDGRMVGLCHLVL